ncbi:MAG TPA: hypothetical protein VF156_15420 [Agromyces sp.]
MTTATQPAAQVDNTSASNAAANGLRERILAARDIKHETVHVDEWGIDLIVRSGTARQRARLLDAAVKPGKGDEVKVDLEKIYPDLVIHSCVDPSVFDENAPEAAPTLFNAADRDALLEKNGSALESIAKVAQKLWGLDEKAVKEAEGNSSDTPSGGSTTTS